MLGTIKGHMLQFNQKPLLVNPICKCRVKVSNTQESMMTSEVSSFLSEGTIEGAPHNKGFFMYPFLIPRKMGKPLYHELKVAEPVHYLHKIQNDHPETDKGCHLSRTVGSLTQHQISILPHSNSKEISLLPSFQLERQSLPVQEFALWSNNCSQDLYKGHKGPSCTYFKRWI